MGIKQFPKSKKNNEWRRNFIHRLHNFYKVVWPALTRQSEFSGSLEATSNSFGKTQEILIARPSHAVEVNTLKPFLKALNIKFEIAKESPYRAEFVAKIEKSRRDYKAGGGKVITVSELEKLRK